MGESFGVYQLGNDESILDYVSSANIACGFHAGDPATMRKTVNLALQKGVAIGAHPGLPDLLGFGRRQMVISNQEAYDMVVYQIGALNGFVKASGGHLTHVKPHGALYNMAVTDPVIAEAIAEAVYNVNPTLVFFGLSNSELIQAAKKIGLKTANEVFADRTYQADGTLTPRSHPDCFVENNEAALQQVIQMVKEKKVMTLQAKTINIIADTVCIHGDGPHALAFAKTIKAGLSLQGIGIANFTE